MLLPLPPSTRWSVAEDEPPAEQQPPETPLPEPPPEPDQPPPDSDGDHLPNGEEEAGGTDSANPDTDYDGNSDAGMGMRGSGPGT